MIGSKPKRATSHNGPTLARTNSSNSQRAKKVQNADSNVEQILINAQSMELKSFQNIEKKRLNYINKLSLA